MKTSDVFYSVSAVILLSTIAYFSVITKTIVEEYVTVEEVIVNTTDTLFVTTTDTVFEYKNYSDDIIFNEGDLLLSKRYLFQLADDTNISNEIRNILPFGDVFNYWREELGPCGLFDWNGQIFTTLYKEEPLGLCDVNF
jgi:hypothetical protein|tara:strand:+ start:1469 stop:1885 length:417 start_codon:yes stop_codon:yes gene_type:complete